MTIPTAPCRMIDVFPDYEQIVFLDVETTGLTAETNRIIELAAIRHFVGSADSTEDMKIDVLVKIPNGGQIPELIVELTGITDDRLEKEGITEPAAAETFTDLFMPTEKTLIIAHNAQFDLSFVLKMLERCGKSMPAIFDILDTFTVLKDRKAYPHTLKDAIEYYAIEGVKNTHRAIDDVEALYEIVLYMKKERDDLEDYINLIGVHRVHGLWGDEIAGVTYGIQLLGSKRKRLPDFIREGKRLYSPEKIKNVQPQNFKDC